MVLAVLVALGEVVASRAFVVAAGQRGRRAGELVVKAERRAVRELAQKTLT